jgi:hypothetical protein
MVIVTDTVFPKTVIIVILIITQGTETHTVTMTDAVVEVVVTIHPNPMIGTQDQHLHSGSKDLPYDIH